MRSTVVAASNSPKTFLPCSVPLLHIIGKTKKSTSSDNKKPQPQKVKGSNLMLEDNRTGLGMIRRPLIVLNEKYVQILYNIGYV